MALFTASNVKKWLHLDEDVSKDIASPLHKKKAERDARILLGDADYEDIRDNKASGDDKYDRTAQAEALIAFASYIETRGSLRLSEKGGLVRDLGIVNQQQTIRQLLSQDQVEQVTSRLRDQAEGLVEDIRSSASVVWNL